MNDDEEQAKIKKLLHSPETDAAQRRTEPGPLDEEEADDVAGHGNERHSHFSKHQPSERRLQPDKDDECDNAGSGTQHLPQHVYMDLLIARPNFDDDAKQHVENH